MLRHLRPALVLLLAFTLLTGVAYPLAVTGIARLAFPHQASGSLIVRNGRVIGAETIGQRFSAPHYFHGRPSAGGYDAMASGGSNLAPSNRRLIERIAADAAVLRLSGPGAVPVDLVTTSGSGLDPHISPAAARFQVRRVAAARKLPPDQLRDLIDAMTEPRTLGILGERRVNVLKLNLALDDLRQRRH
jgi:K+-transporting ATPase ATPase C chain